MFCSSDVLTGVCGVLVVCVGGDRRSLLSEREMERSERIELSVLLSCFGLPVSSALGVLGGRLEGVGSGVEMLVREVVL